jgi:hypothetical protein
LIGSSAAFQAADQFKRHVAVALNLAAQPNTWLSDFTSSKRFLLGLGHLVRLARDKFHAASGASSVTTAGVKLIRSGIFHKGLDKSLSSNDIKFTDTLNVQLWHKSDSQ